jgi:hypothetical protein
MKNAANSLDVCTDSCQPAPWPATQAVLWLQGITLAWMVLECGVALYAAQAAHSVVLLAFGCDSLVELLSAAVVLLTFAPHLKMSPELASRWAALLLFVLAGGDCAHVGDGADAWHSGRIQQPRHGDYHSGVDCYADSCLGEAKTGCDNGKRGTSGRRGAVGDLCLAGGRDAGGAGGQRVFSSELD